MLERVGVVEIVIGGYIRADVNGTGDLVIRPESEDTKLVRTLSIGSDSLTIIALTWTALIHFSIGQLGATGPHAAMNGWPPYLNVTIESFSNAHLNTMYNFTGTAFFSFAELPEPSAMVSVDVLWIGDPVRFPFTIQNASRFMVQGKVKIASTRSTFIPAEWRGNVLLFGFLIFLLYKFMNKRKSDLKTDKTSLVDAPS
jgi:hypothetical protein